MNQMKYNQEFLEEQRQFLKDLITFREPLKKLEARDKLGHVWDDQPEEFYLALLTREHVISVLQRFLNYELSEKEVYGWAESLESRETVQKEPGYISVIFDVLSDITLEYDIGYNLTPERAQALIHELQTAQFDPEDV